MVCVVGVTVAYVVAARRLPADAPLARMYRTEADLALLVTAVESYFNAHRRYPPAGPEGLRIATDHLSKTVDYLPDGPPLDAWGQPYCYAPHTAYRKTGAGALRGDDGYYAAETYQIYSLGADRDPGIDDPVKRQDNISSWDASKSWRTVYHARNKAFGRRGNTQP